jgi:hypothetical protein
VILRHQAVPAYAIGLALGTGAVGGLAGAPHLLAQTAMLTLAVAMAAVIAYGLSRPELRHARWPEANR